VLQGLDKWAARGRDKDILLNSQTATFCGQALGKNTKAKGSF